MVHSEAMDYERLQSLFATSPSMKLLRARHAPLVLSFLYQEFKLPNRIAIPNYELADKLADYLETIGFQDDEEDPINDVKLRAKLYLDAWCSEQNRYLRKYPGDKGEDLHELTPATEKVIQWIQDLEHKEFVGTESMFLDIVRKLHDLYQNSTDDPAQRLALLHKQKAELEAQIQEIETANAVRVYSATQVKERFYEINRSARQLLADFREVEQNFRAIVRSLYQQQSDAGRQKGEILGYVLDETNALKETDQGKSFYTFWHLLMDHARRDDFDQIVEQSYNILLERGVKHPDPLLKHLKFHLHEAGKKVVETNQVLVEKLKRILAGQTSLERRRTTELMNAIKQLATKLAANPPLTDNFIEIEGEPIINLIMERPLGEMPEELVFENHPLEVGSDDWTEVDFTRLIDHFEINKEELVNRIQSHLKRKKQVTLTEILHEHPIQKGLEELLTYFSIASQSSKHLITSDKYELIALHGESGRRIKVPQIIFTK